MLFAVMGTAISVLGIWLIFALRPTETGPHRALMWPMADMLVPVGVVMLMILGPMLVVYGLVGN